MTYKWETIKTTGFSRKIFLSFDFVSFIPTNVNNSLTLMIEVVTERTVPVWLPRKKMTEFYTYKAAEKRGSCDKTEE